MNANIHEQVTKAASVQWSGEWATIKGKTDADSPRNRAGTLADFVADLAMGKDRPAKDGHAVIGASFGTIPNDKGHFRHKKNIKAVFFLLFDMDHKAPEDVQKSFDAFQGTVVVAMSSWRNGTSEKEGEPPDTRFRLFIPLSRPVSVEEQGALWKWGASKLAAVCSSPPDGAAKDASRLFYGLRAKNPEAVTDPWLRVIEGALLNPDCLPGGGCVADLLKPKEPPRPPVKKTRKTANDNRSKYLHAALDRACDAVRDATISGGSHETLLKESHAIGGFVDYGAFSFDEALDRIVGAAVSAGFPEHEARRVAQDGLNEGQKKPRALPPTANKAEKQENTKQNEENREVPLIRIMLGVGTLKDMTDQAINALIGAGVEIYQRAGDLVSVKVDERVKLTGIRWPPGEPRIMPLSGASLRENIDLVSEWERYDSRDGAWKTARVPRDIVENIMGRGEWDFRTLTMVFETPTMRIDGSLVDKPGWDDTTGIFFMPKPGESWNIPQNPTANDIKAAKVALEEVHCDFPFEKPCHRGAAVAGILSLLTGLTFTNRPLFLWDANVRGAGKTLGADVSCIIATGRDFPKMVQGADDSEDRKRITALAMIGARAVLVDNIVGKFGNAAIDAALTANGVWEDRLLAQNKTWKGPLFLTWFASGNNVEVHGDLARRVIPIRMLSEEERPERRTGFKHADLRAWAKSNRVRLATAGLTLLRGFVNAGRPDQKLFNFGSFEEWSELIRNAVVWADFDDPCKGNEDIQEKADTDVLAFSAVLQSWYALFKEVPYTLAKIARLTPEEGDDKLPNLIDALTNLAPNDKGGGWNIRKAAWSFRRYEKRVIKGLRLEQCAETKTGAAWKVKVMRHTAT